MSDLVEVAPAPLQGTVLPPGGAPNFEVAAIMEELSKLQHWCTLHMIRQVPGGREAADLVQRTRCFIVERLYPNARR